MKDLRRITEGMSGAEAATVIYNNDSDHWDKVAECKASLEANKAYAAQVNAGGKTNITVTSFTGTSTTDVMSQSGVTTPVNSINDRIDKMAVISDEDIEDGVTDGPVVNIVSATYATQAMYDSEGHTIASIVSVASALESRITELE